MLCLQECTRYKTDKDICLCVLAYIYLCQRDIAGGWSHHTRGLSVNNRRAVTSSNPGSCQIQSWLPTNTEPFTKSCYSATEGEETLRSVPAICNQVTQAAGTGRSMYTQVGYDKSRYAYSAALRKYFICLLPQSENPLIPYVKRTSVVAGDKPHV